MVWSLQLYTGKPSLATFIQVSLSEKPTALWISCNLASWDVFHICFRNCFNCYGVFAVYKLHPRRKEACDLTFIAVIFVNLRSWLART